jgi:ribosome-associated translation inhibitor RaiA
MIELERNITLVGFKEIEFAELSVVEKLIKDYVKKISNNKPINNLTLTVKQIHHTDENSSKFELKAKLDLDGKIYNSEVIDYNIFIGIDNILKKIDNQIK